MEAIPTWPYAAGYEECVALCRDFVDVVFEHYPREANMVAHTLASKN
jgi:hypothetical protein